MPTKLDSAAALEDQSSEERPHVLVVDDDHEMAHSLKLALEREGYRASVAGDGNQGLAIAEAKRPDMIILDIMMPRRSGFLVLERLRQELDDPVPVIILTGNMGDRHRAYAEMLGVVGYFYKPVKFPQLIDTINELLDDDA